MDLEEPRWGDVVARDPFGEILISGLGVIAVFLVADAGTGPSWLLLDPGLSALCFAIAFQRILQARRIEGLTASAWDEVSVAWRPRERGVDEFLEGVYQLGLHTLPFAAISVTVFVPLLLATELATVGHQWLFLRGERRYLRDRGYVDPPTSPVRRLFVWRLRTVAVRAAGLGILTPLLWGAAPRMWSPRTSALSGLVLLLLDSFVREPLTSPLRQRSPAPVTSIQDVTVGAALPERDLRRLEDVVRRSFAGDEPVVRDLVERTGHDGHRLLVLREGDDPVGLLAFQRSEDRGFLWWIAVDPRRRGEGHGRRLLAAALDRLGDVAMTLFESDVTTAPPEVRRAREALVAVSSAERVPGLHWRSPQDGSFYSMFLVRGGPVLEASALREALAAMARFSLRHHPDARDLALERVSGLDLSSLTARSGCAAEPRGGCSSTGVTGRYPAS